MRGGGIRAGMRGGMGGWFDGWSMDSFVYNINPLNSPVTQAVVQGTAQAVVGVTQVVTAPLVAAASAVGVDLNPMHSPVFAGVVKPAADLLGTALLGVPLGTAAAAAGGLVGGLQDKYTGSGAYRPYTPQQLVVQVPAQAAPRAVAAPTATAPTLAALQRGVPAVAVNAGYSSGTWPRYYGRR